MCPNRTVAIGFSVVFNVVPKTWSRPPCRLWPGDSKLNYQRTHATQWWQAATAQERGSSFKSRPRVCCRLAILLFLFTVIGRQSRYAHALCLQGVPVEISENG